MLMANMPPDPNTIILLNAVHPALAERYAPQQVLAEHLNLSMEGVHAALADFEMTCFTAQMTANTPCERVESMEHDLLRIEREAGATLQQLAQQRRLVLLLEGAVDQPRLDLAMALALQVAAMSGSWPDILSIQYDDRRPDTLQILNHLQVHEVLVGYQHATAQGRQRAETFWQASEEP